MAVPPPPQPPSEPALRRSRAVIAGIVVALSVAGAVIALAGGSKTIAGFLIGVGAILAVGRVFYEVGVSEDRERAQGRS